MYVCTYTYVCAQIASATIIENFEHLFFLMFLGLRDKFAIYQALDRQHTPGWAQNKEKYIHGKILDQTRQTSR